jgi:hypothetical protein
MSTIKTLTASLSVLLVILHWIRKIAGCSCQDVAYIRLEKVLGAAVKM